MKIARSKTKNVKPKHTQTKFSYVEHTKMSRNPQPEYTPPKPSEMTNAELEKWYISSPSEKLKSEILARINKGVKFSKFRMVQYLGMKPQLAPVFVPVFRDESNTKKENKVMDKNNPGDSGKTETLETITIRVVLNPASNTYAVSINPWKKRVLVNAEKIAVLKDGSFVVKTSTPIQVTDIETNEC